MFVKKHFFFFLLLLVFLLPACGKDDTDISNIISPTEELSSTGTPAPSLEAQGSLGDPSLEWMVFELADFLPQ